MTSRDDTDQSMDEETSNTRQRYAAGSRLTSQSRNMIMNVLQFFTSEGRMKTMNEIIKATATATQVSERTVYRIKSEKITSSDGIQSSPVIRGGYVPGPPANDENPRIRDAPPKNPPFPHTNPL